MDTAVSLTIFNAASSPQSLRASLLANIVGMIGVILYTSYVHRTFSGKVQAGDDGLMPQKNWRSDWTCGSAP